jgi:tight adherence protein B
MRRLLTLAGATSASLAFLLCGQAAAQTLELSPAGKPRFPNRAYALTLPSARSVGPGQVTVKENGRSVAGATALPGTLTGAKALGVVLVIDASDSMAGDPIAQATAAARTLADHRNAEQSIGIVAFNHRAIAILPPTTDQAKIDAALVNPPELARGTRIYDAVGAGLDMLQQAGISGGSLVVLSDGSDTGSRSNVDEVAGEARAAGVRVYTVGLRSSAFDPGPLQQLADTGRGSYSEASSADQLAGIYGHLGQELANQYLVRYRSDVGPSKDVHVAISIDGVPGVATTEYTTPALHIPAAPPFRRSLQESFWRSSTALIAVSVLAALLLAIALAALIQPRNRSRALRRRIAAYSSGSGESVTPALTAVADRLVLRTEESLEKTSWWPAVKQDIEVARIPLPPAQVAALTLLGTIFLAYVLTVLTGSIFGAVFALATPFVVLGVMHVMLKRVRDQFADQLADHLQMVASAMRAGHSFVGALSVANEDAPEPTRREFDRAIADERLGVAIEDALDQVSDRMANPDLVHAALVAKLQRETGANAAEVLDRVAATIRERQELRRHIRALTAQQRLARWVLTGLPIALLVALTIINPGYIDPLFSESGGRIMLIVGALGIVAGGLVMKKLTDIKV